MDRPLRIGISACLLGDMVRHDGGHKRDEHLAGLEASLVEWVRVCPEAELGMGVPRPPVLLVRPPAGAEPGLRMVDPASGADHTAAMLDFSARRAAALAAADLDGFVLKMDSPSCGLERVRVFDGSGVARREGVGLFAAALLQAMPSLPVEEEGRLADPDARAAFFERVSAYRRRKAAVQPGGTAGSSR